MFHACFTWLGIILPSPHCFHRCNQFSKRSTQICHCFPHSFPIVHCLSQISEWRLHCLQNLGKNWTSAHHMCVISSYRNCNFSIAFPLRDNGPTSEPQFYLASFYPLPILSTVFPRVSIFQAFYSNFPLLSHFFPLFYIIVSHFSIVFLIIFPSFPICFPLFLCHIPSFFHCFSHDFPSFSPPFPFFPIVYYHIPSFFPLFFSSFSPSLQSPQVHLGGRTRGESIPHRHPIATWYISLKNFTCGHLFYHLISRFLASWGRSAPRPP